MRFGRVIILGIHINLNLSVLVGASVINLNLCEAVRSSDFRQIARLVWLREHSVLRIRSDSGIDQSVSLLVARSCSYPLIQLVSGSRSYRCGGIAGGHIAALDH